MSGFLRITSTSNCNLKNFAEYYCYPTPEKLRIGLTGSNDVVAGLPVISAGLTGYGPRGDLLDKRTWLDG